MACGLGEGEVKIYGEYMHWPGDSLGMGRESAAEEEGGVESPEGCGEGEGERLVWRERVAVGEEDAVAVWGGGALERGGWAEIAAEGFDGEDGLHDWGGSETVAGDGF